jgi:hypothetical protein
MRLAKCIKKGITIMKLNSRFCVKIVSLIAMLTTIVSFGMLIRTRKPQSMPIRITNLAPTDSQSMQELGLCPLFIKKEATMDSEIMRDTERVLRQAGLSTKQIKEKLDEMLYPGRVYHVFDETEGNFKEKQVDVNNNVPCIVPLGSFGNWNRTLIQLKTIDQGDLEKGAGLPDGLCAGHSLNNACIIRDYSNTGDVKYLKNLNDSNSAEEFLRSLGIENWLDVNQVKEKLLKMNFIDIDSSNVFAISTAMLFDSHLNKNPEFEVFFDNNEFVAVQKHKAALKKGLQRDYYRQVIVIGNEEVTQSHGHFFAFAIIKTLNEIQYVVLDTFPGGIYHLQEGSHERNRLMFLIQNIEQGFSDINLPNVRMFEYEKSKKELEEQGEIF